MPIQVSEELVDQAYDEWKEKGFPDFPTNYAWRKREFAKLIAFDRSTLYKPKDKAVGTSGHGYALAWSYMSHHWGIKCGTMKTPVEIWEDEVHLKRAIRKLLEGVFWDRQEYHRVTESDKRKVLSRYSGTQVVSNFRPTAAALIYDKFLEKASPLFNTDAGTTWDMSCGYGGRLLGSIAAGVNYIGTDPCTETYVGLEQIRDDWGDKNRTIELHKMGSEEFRPDRNSVNLCFTSPPYFDWEKYSDEDTQSYKKYPTTDEWLEGFLRKTMENCYYGLKEDGWMLMNVANTKRIKTFEEDTVRLGMETGFNYISRWNLQLSSQQAKVKYEPIFVFKK